MKARTPTLLLALLALSLLGHAAAQPSAGEAWTIQTVALRDYAEAQAVADDLRGLGFAAYTEFAMHQGRQWVRVRVGCWLAREGADGVAEILRALVTDEAVAVPLTPAAPVRCVDIEVGFIKPARYLPVHLPGELPTYRIEIADHVAHVRHDGEAWRVLQGEDEPEPVTAPRNGTTYRTGELSGYAVVLVIDDGAASVFCPGRLVAQVGDVAVVDWANAIVACLPATVPDGA